MKIPNDVKYSTHFNKVQDFLHHILFEKYFQTEINVICILNSSTLKKHLYKLNYKAYYIICEKITKDLLYLIFLPLICFLFQML